LILDEDLHPALRRSLPSSFFINQKKII